MMTTTTTVNFRFLLLALILIVAPFIQVGKCQSYVDSAESVDEGGDIGIVGEDVQDFGEEAFSAAAGVETTYVFPHNSVRLVKAGEKTELLVGIKNNGESALNVLAIKSSIHLPYDHRYQIQNLTTFNQSTVPPSATATYPYLFAVSPFLQSGNFDLVATVIYEIDQSPYQTTFYNGTIEVVEAGVVVSIESIFLITLGIALLVFLGIWVRGQVQNLSKYVSSGNCIFSVIGQQVKEAAINSHPERVILQESEGWAEENFRIMSLLLDTLETR